MHSSILIQEFLNESSLSLWFPESEIEEDPYPIQISGLIDVLHLPRVPALCLFPFDLLNDWSKVKILFFNILHVLDIRHFLVLFGKNEDLNEWIVRIQTRTAAKKILSFGVNLDKHFSSYALTHNLAAVLKNPLLKSQVWKDVSKFLH